MDPAIVPTVAVFGSSEPMPGQPAYDEHIGESAYMVAMAAWLSRDPELQTAADELTAKLAADGAVGQLRSFNWQCRSAVATSWFLQR